jgi:hypothetical protein
VEEHDLFRQILADAVAFKMKQVEKRAEGYNEGNVLVLKQTLMDIVSLRYPSLKTLARERVSHLKNEEELRALINPLLHFPSEDGAREILSAPPKA